MAVQQKLISADEFWEIAHLPENADKHMELIDGVIYEMPLFGMKHGIIAGNLVGIIGMHIRAQRLGHAMMNTGCCLSADTVLAPDIGFIAKARAGAEPVRKFVPFAPDLAVEVVSPNDTASDIHTKVNKYLQYGTQAVWVAYPETRTVVVHTASGAVTLSEDDSLDGGDILPAFKLPIRDIFA